MGFVHIKSFKWDSLSPDKSKTMHILYEGITRDTSKPGSVGRGDQFFYPEAL
jgi:hypothetical protein